MEGNWHNLLIKYINRKDMEGGGGVGLTSDLK